MTVRSMSVCPSVQGGGRSVTVKLILTGKLKTASFLAGEIAHTYVTVFGGK